MLARLKLVDDWAHKWWRLWSMRLGMLVSAIIAWVAYDPASWDRAVSYLPEPARPALGMLAFAAIFLSRMAAQPEVKPRGD